MLDEFTWIFVDGFLCSRQLDLEYRFEIVKFFFVSFINNNNKQNIIYIIFKKYIVLKFQLFVEIVIWIDYYFSFVYNFFIDVLRFSLVTKRYVDLFGIGSQQ